MKHIHILGIDIAKNTFELCGIDKEGGICYTKRVSRQKFLEVVSKLNVTKVGMEACGGANYWCRQLAALGFTVKLMSPQYVKPYIQTNKNDRNDAAGIAEACSRETVRAVLPKTVEQQNIQSTLRVRERLVSNRTRLINELRGLLLEYGIVIPQGARNIYKALPVILEDTDNELSTVIKTVLNQLYIELLNLDETLAVYDQLLTTLFNQSTHCQRLEKIPGVGKLTALAIIALVGDATVFKNARQFAAFLGLVPRQHSSGGKEKLLGISKRGDKYTRKLLIHGARSMLYWSNKRDTAHTRWLRALKERRGSNRACIALANKQARIIWALLARNSEFIREKYEDCLLADYRLEMPAST